MSLFLAGDRYKSMVEDFMSQAESVIGEKVEPKKIKKKELDIIKPNMFFFDVENPNHVFKRQVRSLDAQRNNEATSNPRHKHHHKTKYGTKWYLHPKKWAEFSKKQA